MDRPADVASPCPVKPKALALASLSKLLATRWQQPKPSYPPISSIPKTSSARMAQSPVIDSKSEKKTDEPAANTVLYLAYGSNLAAETFLGVRKIRPLSQMNVSVPALRLTFDLPGIPYGEPCFANVDWRKLPGDPKLPPVPKLPPTPPIDPPRPPHAESWAGELIGVVYEVTREDYARIIATEGGGASYKEIIVPCLPLPARVGVPEKPPTLPKPFLARTLFAPYIPEEIPDDPNKDKWWYKFVTPVHRPSPNYAQASARYLQLIKDGAAEHDLPGEYQRYLRNLQPYTRTTCRQKLGFLLFMVLLFPFFLVLITIGRLSGNKKGTLPPWLMVTFTVFFNVLWLLYDAVLKPVFGDGERTADKKTGGRSRVSRSYRRMSSACDEETASLIGEEANDPERS